jgi:hypothetical protein
MGRLTSLRRSCDERFCGVSSGRFEKGKEGKKREGKRKSVTMRSWYIIKVLGSGPVDALCVILEMILVLLLCHGPGL